MNFKEVGRLTEFDPKAEVRQCAKNVVAAPVLPLIHLIFYAGKRAPAPMQLTHTGFHFTRLM